MLAVYGGADHAAEAAALEFRRERNARESQRQARRDLIDRLREFEVRIVENVNETKAAFGEAMRAAGCYQHKRQWRRRSKPMMNAKSPEYRAALAREKARRAFEGDQDGKLRATYGANLDLRVQDDLIARFTSDPMAGEAVRREAEAMRAEFAAEGNSPIERRLIETIITTWMDLAYHDNLCARRTREDSIHIGVWNAMDKIRDRACKRHLQAVRWLALVRKLAAPSTQTINISTVVKERRKKRSKSDMPQSIADRLGAPCSN